MGAVGGILYLGVAAVLYPNSKTAGLDHVNYQPLFIVVSAIMFIAIAILFLTVKEPKLTAENQALEKQHPEWNLAQDDGSGHETLPKPVKKSLGFLLASIALWFIGYNGVTTWFSTYVDVVMGQGLGGASTCLLIATAGAIVSYIPIGQIASKIGRRRTIQGGIVLLTICFALGYVLTTAFSSINAIMFIVFALVGLAWAAINVNSLPMVVEMCKGSDIGKFTGYYYTASMAAQVVTPVVAGTMDAEDRLPRAVPLRRAVRRPELRHHALRPPRRRQSRSQKGAGRIRGYGRLIPTQGPPPPNLPWIAVE